MGVIQPCPLFCSTRELVKLIIDPFRIDACPSGVPLCVGVRGFRHVRACVRACVCVCVESPFLFVVVLPLTQNVLLKQDTISNNTQLFKKMSRRL